MCVLVVANPRSGRGRAIALARAILGSLERHNAHATLLETGPHLPEALQRESPDALVVCGGDGTVHHLLQHARSAPALLPPIYHAPTGTENLFAREFGMWPPVPPDEVARRVLRAASRSIDLGVAGERAFSLMMSVGFDASVVERVCAARTGRITRWSYARPILREAVRPTLARVRVSVDGRRIVDGNRGLLIIANVRQYAARLNPAGDADPSDGLLDVTFMAAGRASQVIRWSLLCWSRAQRGAVGCVMARAREIEIESLEAEAPMQMDGEFAGRLMPGKPGVIRVAPGAMRVVAVEPPERQAAMSLSKGLRNRTARDSDPRS